MVSGTLERRHWRLLCYACYLLLSVFLIGFCAAAPLIQFVTGRRESKINYHECCVSIYSSSLLAFHVI